MNTSRTAKFDALISAENADRVEAGIETDKYDLEYVSLVKRDEAPTTAPTRTHSRGHGSPVPGSPVPYSKAESLLDLEGSMFHNISSRHRILLTPRRP